MFWDIFLWVNMDNECINLGKMFLGTKTEIFYVNNAGYEGLFISVKQYNKKRLDVR